MTAPVILGVDPGARTVGAVLRSGAELLGHTALVRDNPLGPIESWIDDVLANLHDLTNGVNRVDVVAIEGVNAPSPHMGMINVAPTLETALVAGAVAGWAMPDGFATVIVPPDRFGAPVEGLTGPTARQALLQRYPADLVGPRETTGSGKGPLQHVRAAYDVAGAAGLLLRMRGAA